MKWILLVVLAGCVQPGATSEPAAPWEGICEHLNHIQDRPLVVAQVPEMPEGYEDPKYYIEARMWPWDENTREIKQPDDLNCVAFPGSSATKYMVGAKTLPYEHCYSSTATGSFVLSEGEVRLFPPDAWRPWDGVCEHRDA